MTRDDSQTALDPGISIDAGTVIETFPRVGLTPDSPYVRTITQPASPAETVPAETVLRSALADPYPHALFSHQANALQALAEGEHVTVSTSTSSGKTHVYGLQIARNLIDAGVLDSDGNRTAEHNRGSTALCVYPMKALAKDQQEALDDLYATLGLDIRVEIYDGDTTQGRQEIREQADVILTNFAALNVYLEHHDKWSRFYSALDLVAIDESHTYTGIQGMHVAWILRRMQRVVDYWGGDPQYTLTSATIGNPQSHSETLINDSVTVVDTDGSPHGPREIVLWNPPPVGTRSQTSPDQQPPEQASVATSESDDSGDVESIAERIPASVEAPKVFNHLTAEGIQTLLFCPSRKLTELAIQRADAHYQDNPGVYQRPATNRYEAYNAGLGRQTRHAREQQFKSGQLTGLATTSALELGIDIGDLDATVLMGYPGQRQAFWQRIGRAGRSGTRSLAVLVGDHRTLDKYIIDHPEYLLDSDVEDAVVDISNNAVFATHVLAAADELALDTEDIRTFAEEDRLRAAVKMWREAGFVNGYLDAAVHYCGPGRPQTRVNLYGTTETDYRLTLADDVNRDRWDVPDDLDLEPVEQNRAYRDYHEGAVRLLNGQQFEVTSVDEDRPRPEIELTPVDCEYYTQTRSKVNVLDAKSEQSRTINGFTLHYGTGTVLVHHHAYDQRYIGNNSPKQQAIPTNVSPIQMDTQLCWIEVPSQIETALVDKYSDYGVETGVDQDATAIPQLGYIAGLHAAEHATIQTAPLELRVDKTDLGGLSTLVMDTHFAHPEHPSITDSIDESFEAAARALEERSQQLSGQSTSGWFIYDAVDGGLGFAKAIYENFESLAERARDQLATCRCGRPNGCPACTFDENCGNDNKPLLRASAIDVLDQFLDSDTALDIDQSPDQSESERRPVIFYS